MNKEVVILIAEDDEGHAELIKMNLKKAGINNQVQHFLDGQEVLDFLFMKGKGPYREHNFSYLLLLDIRMPKMNGIDVLKAIKNDAELKKMPVIMITTTDSPMEVQRCHELGCNSYVTKPVDYDKFVEAIRQLGLYLLVIEIPTINGV